MMRTVAGSVATWIDAMISTMEHVTQYDVDIGASDAIKDIGASDVISVLSTMKRVGNAKIE